MHAVIVGPGGDIGAALETQGIETSGIDDFANRPALESAGVVDADLLVITDVGQATAIPVAKNLNAGIKVVVYADDSVPEFARGQADLIIDPDLLGADAVAEELAA